MISKIAKVFTTNKAINHFLWPFPAALHKANPFQGMVQSKIGNNHNEFSPNSIFLTLMFIVKFDFC